MHANKLHGKILCTWIWNKESCLPILNDSLPHRLLSAVYILICDYTGEKRQLLCVDPDNLSNLNSAALGGTHQFKVKSILCRPPSSEPSRLSFTLVLVLSILFCYNYVSNSKCNCRRVGEGGGVVLCVWREKRRG